MIESGLLGLALKKAPSCNPCMKALASTSNVVMGTSKAATLKRWRYSCRDSPSFCLTGKRLITVFLWYLLLANWWRKSELNSFKDRIDPGGIQLNHCKAAWMRVVRNTQHLTPSV